MSTDFQSPSVTGILVRKFAIKMSLQIPPHLKGVATLPCEILAYFKVFFKNAPTEITATAENLAEGVNAVRECDVIM